MVYFPNIQIMYLNYSVAVVSVIQFLAWL